MTSTPINRRKFLGASAGLAGAATLGGWASTTMSADAANPNNEATRGGRIVPRGQLSIQQFSVRDAVTRADKAVKGYLGGPNFPQDPTDLGPLVDLPGGWNGVFAYLRSVGYNGFEFFNFAPGGSTAGITIPQLRSLLKANDLESSGTHTGNPQQLITPANLQAQIDIAKTLGHRMIGFAGNPIGGNQAAAPATTLAAWQQVATDINTIGAQLRAVGIKYFSHPEQDWFRFFADPAHPELDRVHRLDWITDHTDPRYFFFEPDTSHTLNGRARFPDPVDGRLFDHNRWFAKLDKQDRLIAWHIKDSNRVLKLQDTSGVAPYSQNVTRPGFFNNPDVVYVGEGTTGKGYPVDPDPEVLGYQYTFTRFRLSDPRWFVTESDNAIGNAADPGKSLRHAKLAAQYMLNLKKADDHGCDEFTV
jgi:sugar phosphate isomerase/epimerase